MPHLPPRRVDAHWQCWGTIVAVTCAAALTPAAGGAPVGGGGSAVDSARALGGAPAPREARGDVSRDRIEEIGQWLAKRGGDAPSERWRRGASAAPASRVGGLLCELAPIADARVGSLVDSPGATPPPWLAETDVAGPSIRLAIAERLAADERYDECLAWIDGLEPASVYSPDLLHYLRAVAFRMTVDDPAFAASLKALEPLDASEASASLGLARGWLVEAMRRELREEEAPLPNVARRMEDVERRLALREAGAGTQERQQRVVEELDRLIKELEEQRQRQRQQQAASSGGSGASEPAEDSRPSELKGPGEIDRKRLVVGDAWGALTPAERERLTQALTRDYPPRYRALVEDYFRSLAEGELDEEAGPNDPPAGSDEDGGLSP